MARVVLILTAVALVVLAVAASGWFATDVHHSPQVTTPQPAITTAP